MSCKTPKQINQVVPSGDTACWPHLIHEGAQLEVMAQAESGATEIRVNALDTALTSGDVIDFEIEPGVFYRVEVTGAAAAGQDTDQNYRTVPIKTVGDTALRRRILKETVGYLPANISSRTFEAILWDASASPASAIATYDNAAINKDSGTPATRGKVEITISAATSAELAVSVTTGGAQLDAWVSKQLPKLSADSVTPHPLRIELQEIVDGQTVQVSFGVVAVTPGLVVAA